MWRVLQYRLRQLTLQRSTTLLILPHMEMPARVMVRDTLLTAYFSEGLNCADVA